MSAFICRSDKSIIGTLDLAFISHFHPWADGILLFVRLSRNRLFDILDCFSTHFFLFLCDQSALPLISRVSY